MGDMKANDAWKIYLAAPDINEVVVKGEELGAQFFMAPTPVGDMGIQTVFNDATGAALGAWQPLSFPGFMTSDEHGSPCWFELNARDFSAAVNFYASVFGLDTQVKADTDEFRYTTLMAEGHEVAGILDASSRLPEGAPSHWVTSWQVDDIDAAVVRVRQLGGAVHEAPFDSPDGRIAAVADPAGAVFKLRGSSPG